MLGLGGAQTRGNSFLKALRIQEANNCLRSTHRPVSCAEVPTRRLARMVSSFFFQRLDFESAIATFSGYIFPQAQQVRVLSSFRVPISTRPVTLMS